VWEAVTVGLAVNRRRAIGRRDIVLQQLGSPTKRNALVRISPEARSSGVIDLALIKIRRCFLDEADHWLDSAESRTGRSGIWWRVSATAARTVFLTTIDGGGRALWTG